MPRLTPAELQEARRRSGKLGGRPRKPTVEEARAAALEELVPRSLQVLRAHLGDGAEVNPNAWRAALRVFEHAFGRPREEPQETIPTDELDLQSMSSSELEALRHRLMSEQDEEHLLRVVQGEINSDQAVTSVTSTLKEFGFAPHP